MTREQFYKEAKRRGYRINMPVPKSPSNKHQPDTECELSNCAIHYERDNKTISYVYGAVSGYGGPWIYAKGEWYIGRNKPVLNNNIKLL